MTLTRSTVVALAAMLGVSVSTLNVAAQSGEEPAIWPDRSAAMGGNIRVLGWNLEPLTDYEFVLIAPDGSNAIGGVVTTDDEGGLLGGSEGVGEPFSYSVSAPLGVYEVRAYEYPWTGDLDEAPSASTSFFHNNFGS